MDASTIERLLNVLGCERIKYSHSWVNATCPFASLRHDKGQDRRPSFGVSISPQGESHIHCHACGVHGTVREMVWRLGLPYRNNPPHWYVKACKLVMRDAPSEDDLDRKIAFSENDSKDMMNFRREEYWGALPPRSAPKIPTVDALEYGTLPEKDLLQFSEVPPPVMDYLTGPRRRLTHTTIALFGLGWQPYRRRIIVPVRDYKGNLVAITGRSLDKQVKDPDTGETRWVPEQEPKFMHSKGFRRDYFLFGEHVADTTDEAILVEGHFDVMYLRQMGFPSTVGVMGSHLSVVQVAKLKKFFKRVIILPDGDEAGAKAAQAWAHALKGHLSTAVVEVGVGRDPDDYDQDELDDMLTFDNLTFV